MAERDKLKALLRAKKTGSCWCQVGIGNPMLRDHTDACKAIRRALGEA